MTEFNANPSPNKVLTVTELNRLARNILEQSFPLFWVSGEISNFTRAASGHWYFSLKDSGAQVRCVMFKGRNSYVDFMPREGDKIEARCTVTLYEARGDFQLTVEFVQRAGLGALFEAFEKLKIKLATEGLFDEANKKSIPKHPKQIGIVTSADAAALRDVLTTLKRRMPNISVIIYPTPVQGKGAAQLIANAINMASHRAECDLLIICRGGGSIEDLWQFNEEVVARAVAQCAIPTISGVGHETDFTICDFVADIRAATPTAAAELAVPSREALLHGLNQLKLQLIRTMQLALNQRAQSLDYIARRLISPAQQVEQQKMQLAQIAYRLGNLVTQQLNSKQQHLLRLGQNLQHLNPQAVLTRGYAFVQNSDGAIINSSIQLKSGDAVKLTLSHGSADAIISKTNT
ncbi:MAG: exodeoxyribonuclease VII large subunit [Methylotenera sp. 24-45-7]|nr:MAG: exodeoxyribonuclease VII large subunit [Methylotenera sp. 24-45-7]OZA08628.1 MAG: exodeoxyribonuclease VII large subunit [Methylotenera sp. 17-45-7]OZA54318.1 MAG: exodeoxyribonuclease VII large subunit [Methylophilales bacterium 39-45-7]HQS36925.1 exodeoxyribonuclease VII large subunit [Methylotenera sp.]HQS44013.1 exodeoxyribonuclease VII large subunit [Methylotenera sp.]